MRKTGDFYSSLRSRHRKLFERDLEMIWKKKINKKHKSRNEESFSLIDSLVARIEFISGE